MSTLGSEIEVLSGDNIQTPVLSHFSYRNQKIVEDYLNRHPQINDFLVDSWPTITKYFGETVNIVLEVMTYPAKNAYDELVGWIQSTDDIQRGLDRLEQLEDELLQEQIAKVGNMFNFNIEFI